MKMNELRMTIGEIDFITGNSNRVYVIERRLAQCRLRRNNSRRRRTAVGERRGCDSVQVSLHS